MSNSQHHMRCCLTAFVVLRQLSLSNQVTLRSNIYDSPPFLAAGTTPLAIPNPPCFIVNPVDIHYDFNSSYVETIYTIQYSKFCTDSAAEDLSLVSDAEVLDVRVGDRILQQSEGHSWEYLQWRRTVIIARRVLPACAEFRIWILSRMLPTITSSGKVSTLTLTRCSSNYDDRTASWGEPTVYTITLSGPIDTHPAMIASGVKRKAPAKDFTRHLNHFRLFKSDSKERHAVRFELISNKHCNDIFIVGGMLLREEYIHTGYNSDTGSNYLDTARKKDLIRVILWAENKQDLARMHWAAASQYNLVSWLYRTYSIGVGFRRYNMVSVANFTKGYYSRRMLVAPASSFDIRSNFIRDSQYIAMEMEFAFRMLRVWVETRVPNSSPVIHSRLAYYFGRQYVDYFFGDTVFRILTINDLRQYGYISDVLETHRAMSIYSVEMYETLLGVAGLRTGLLKFLRDFTNCAATVEDFDKSMEQANNIRLGNLSAWFKQKFLPFVVFVDDHYDSVSETYSFTLRQQVDRSSKIVSIPVKVAFFSADDGSKEMLKRSVIHLHKEEDTFTFKGFKEKPLVSVFHGPSPVRLRDPNGKLDFLKLMGKRDDVYSRWDAGQSYALNYLVKLATDISDGTVDLAEPPPLPVAYVDAFRQILLDKEPSSYWLKFFLIHLPTRLNVEGAMTQRDPNAAYAARQLVMRQLRIELLPELQALMKRIAGIGRGTGYFPLNSSIGARTLRGGLLALLTSDHTLDSAKLAYEESKISKSFTDSETALRCILDIEAPEREMAINNLYEKWKDQEQQLRIWYAARGGTELPCALDEILALRDEIMQREKSPRLVQSYITGLLYGFVKNVQLHRRDGLGYKLFVDTLLMLPTNASFRPFILQSFVIWKSYIDELQPLIKQQLQRIYDAGVLEGEIKMLVRDALEL